MGKASKWFRGLLGLIKPDNSPSPKPPKEKRRWSFVKSYREKDHHHTTVDHHHATTAYGDRHVEGATDPDKHAAAVAITTANTASTAGGIVREEWAAVKIQAAFRGCLARKALRALKGLVKLQALVRGHVERKRTAEWLQRMQALLRAQARARAGRAQILQASYWTAKPSTAHLHGPATPEKFESPIRSVSMKYDHSSPLLKRNGSKSRVHINGNQDKYGNRSDSRVDEQSWNQRRSWIRTCSMDDETSVKILEIDSGKPHITSKRRNLFSSTSQPLVWDQYYSQSLTTTKDSTSYQSGQLQSPSSCEVRSYSPLKINQDEENSPQILSTSKDGGSKRSPFTPTKSDGTKSYLSGYSDYPSYMAYTESSKAKVRSMSAPKQRPHYERSSSLTSKDNPASGRLDKLGLPVGYRY